MAVTDKKYVSAIKAGVIGVVLITAIALFAYYMYERDQYNYWHSDAPMHYDNFCVGVFWIPFFLISMAIIVAITGGLSVRMAGSAIISSKDAVQTAALTGFIIGVVNIALLILGSIGKALFSADNRIFIDAFFLANLIQFAIWLLIYLLIQSMVSAVGGITVWLRKKNMRP